jgi:2-(1,2-epoxy-1,2-dihydrophenyl)acetyl-CoA isomerase
MADLLRVEKVDSTCLLTLNRPESRNAIDRDLLGEITQALRDLPNRIRKEGIDALVITGAGNAFCAGADLKDPSMRHAAPVSILRCDYNPVFVMLRNLSIPVVTAVNGPAIGIGMALALLGDISYATRDAYFQIPFSRFSLASEGGLSFLLPRMVGYRRALEIALGAEKVGAEKAAALGLVNDVFDDPESLMHAAMVTAADLGKRRASVDLIRQAYRESWQNSFEAQLELEARLTGEAVSRAVHAMKRD